MPTDLYKPVCHPIIYRREPFGVLRLCALVLLLLTGAAQAADEQSERIHTDTTGPSTGGFELGLLQLIPYASARYTRASNIYRFSREVAEVTGTDDTADREQRYVAGLDALYDWQQQKLLASIEQRRLTYDTHNDLDHSERLLQLGYVGEFYSHTTALLDLSDERRMASFEDRRSTDLVIERERILRGGVGVAVKPDWKILGGYSHARLDSPLPEAPALPRSDLPGRPASPDFQLEETAVSVGVQYGIENLEHPELEAPLLLTLVLERETVRFKNFVPDDDGQSAEDYRLLSLEATAQYAISGLSTLNGSLGATRFESIESGAGSSIEMTGEISYTRELTAVTQINARVFRRFSPFVPSATVTTDTGFGVGARWEPILGIALLLDYNRTESDFGAVGGGAREGSGPEDSDPEDTTEPAPGIPLIPLLLGNARRQGDFATVGSEFRENSGREDTTQSASFSLVYSRFEYFGLRLFGARSERESNRSYNNYSDNTVGAELSFRWE